MHHGEKVLLATQGHARGVYLPHVLPFDEKGGREGTRGRGKLGWGSAEGGLLLTRIYACLIGSPRWVSDRDN